jgi:hypothetical protein
LVLLKVFFQNCYFVETGELKVLRTAVENGGGVVQTTVLKVVNEVKLFLLK